MSHDPWPAPTHRDGTRCHLHCHCGEGREWREAIESRAESIKEDREPVWHREEWE